MSEQTYDPEANPEGEWVDNPNLDHATNQALKLAHRIDRATTIALEYGTIDGDHHKMWVIDQMLRIMLAEPAYSLTIEDYEEDGEYEWDTGIAP